MKTLKIGITAFLVLLVTTTFGQVTVTIGTPPPWGPFGYTEVRYYYLPDIEIYYDVHLGHYVYFDKGKWYRNRNLPVRYRNYDFYSGYKVVLSDYNGNTPHQHFKSHRVNYPKGYKGKPQKAIGPKKGKGKKQG